MTEKRFTITQDFEEHHRQIRDNGKIIMGCFLEPQAEPIVKLLNELHKENKRLKSDLARIIEQAKKNDEFCRSDIRILENALWCPNCANNIKRLKELKKEFLE